MERGLLRAEARPAIRSIFMRSQSSCSKVGSRTTVESRSRAGARFFDSTPTDTLAESALAPLLRLAAMTLAAFEMPAASYSPAPSLSISSVARQADSIGAVGPRPLVERHADVDQRHLVVLDHAHLDPLDRVAVWASGSWKARAPAAPASVFAMRYQRHRPSWARSLQRGRTPSV